MTEAQQIVFDKVKAMLSEHVPPLGVVKDQPGDFQVTAKKPVVIGKRKMDSVWFAGVVANKSGVTLHFLPVYGDPTLAPKLPPVFMKTLKGKACFHLGEFKPELVAGVAEALRVGLEAYEARGWL